MPNSIPNFHYLSKDYETPRPLPSFEQYKTPYTPQNMLKKWLIRQVNEEAQPMFQPKTIPIDLG